MTYRRFSGADEELTASAEKLVRKQQLQEEVPEYFPKTFRTSLDALVAEKRRSDSPHFLRTSGDQAQVTVSEWKARQVVLDVIAAETTNLVVGQMYFPGWTAFAINSDRTNADLFVRPSVEGLTEVEIPAGTRRVKIVLESHWTEKVGLLITLSSLTCLALIYFVTRSSKNSRTRKRREPANVH